MKSKLLCLCLLLTMSALSACKPAPAPTPDLCALPPAQTRAYPQLLRGQLLAPPLSTQGQQGRLRWPALISSAYAMSIEGEQPQPNQQLILTRHDDRFEPVGQPLVQSTTDAQGGWCMVMDDALKPGPGLMLMATLPQGRLRLPLYFNQDLTLAAQPEALVQLLVQRQIAASKLPPWAWLNMRTVADTATGLMAQVKLNGQELPALIATIQKEALIKDERLLAMLKKWGE